MGIIRSVVKDVLPYGIVRRVQARNEKARVPYPVELREEEKEVLDYVIKNELSMVSRERLFATLLSCKYVVEAGVAGDFVECGVWRGGNSIIAAWIFKMNKVEKKVYLYDTFEGMTRPTEVDVEMSGGKRAKEYYETTADFCKATLEEVKGNFERAGLLTGSVEFIAGDVQETLALQVPEKISVLRLDTDWYRSTRVEMEKLYGRVQRKGVFMVDDYGCWAGSKKAVDEYFEEAGERPFLQYIDSTGRLGIKVE